MTVARSVDRLQGGQRVELGGGRIIARRSPATAIVPITQPKQ